MNKQLRVLVDNLTFCAWTGGILGTAISGLIAYLMAQPREPWQPEAAQTWLGYALTGSIVFSVMMFANLCLLSVLGALLLDKTENPQEETAQTTAVVTELPGNDMAAIALERAQQLRLSASLDADKLEIITRLEVAAQAIQRKQSGESRQLAAVNDDRDFLGQIEAYADIHGT